MTEPGAAAPQPQNLSVWDTSRGWLLAAFIGCNLLIPALWIAGVYESVALSFNEPLHDHDAPQHIALHLLTWTPPVALTAALATSALLHRARRAWWWTAPTGCAICILGLLLAPTIYSTQT